MITKLKIIADIMEIKTTFIPKSHLKFEFINHPIIKATSIKTNQTKKVKSELTNKFALNKFDNSNKNVREIGYTKSMFFISFTFYQ